jgi:excisionase family DNA binding protein
MISVATFCRLTSLGKTKAYELINQARIESVRIDGRRLIKMSSVEALIESENSERGGGLPTTKPQVGM